MRFLSLPYICSLSSSYNHISNGCVVVFAGSSPDFTNVIVICNGCVVVFAGSSPDLMNVIAICNGCVVVFAGSSLDLMNVIAICNGCVVVFAGSSLDLMNVIAICNGCVVVFAGSSLDLMNVIAICNGCVVVFAGSSPDLMNVIAICNGCVVVFAGSSPDLTNVIVIVICVLVLILMISLVTYYRLPCSRLIHLHAASGQHSRGHDQLRPHMDRPGSGVSMNASCAMRSMSDREPTRWQRNRIYPQTISLCECVILIYECVNITCVVRTQALYYTHC